MGLFTTFNRRQDNFERNSDTERLVVDLASFTVGQTPLGKPPWEGDFFAATLVNQEIFEVPSAGYELTLRNDVLQGLFLTLEKFQGTLLFKGDAINLGPQTSRDEIIALLGEPYWTDRDEDEILLFYEYEEGTIELQCEFPDGEHLGFLTLMHQGILSRPDQRKRYGVSKAWPPADPA